MRKYDENLERIFQMDKIKEGKNTCQNHNPFVVFDPNNHYALERISREHYADDNHHHYRPFFFAKFFSNF